MPAFFRKYIPEQCHHGTCLKKATGTLHNNRGEVIGPRCAQHGEQDAKRLNEEG